MTDAARPRIVFDCNVLVQAASNANGPSGRCLELIEHSVVEVYVSRATLKELRAVLAYPSVREKLPGLDDQRIEAFVQRFAFRATLIRDVPHVFDYPRARQDEPYIDLAAAVEATHLVSRDRDLLDLATDHSLIGKEFRQRFPRISVLDPVAFLNVNSK
ncbi:MAG TPA: putative toxin-antitoxin system toxin component, PIN family [Tepidisphaeraceae bacterium]|jgi:putative PIN family toxin of toxin-antitoxin system